MSLSHSKKTSFTKIGHDGPDWACDHNLPMLVLNSLNQKSVPGLTWRIGNLTVDYMLFFFFQVIDHFICLFILAVLGLV